MPSGYSWRREAPTPRELALVVRRLATVAHGRALLGVAPDVGRTRRKVAAPCGQFGRSSQWAARRSGPPGGGLAGDAVLTWLRHRRQHAQQVVELTHGEQAFVPLRAGAADGHRNERPVL